MLFENVEDAGFFRKYLHKVVVSEPIKMVFCSNCQVQTFRTGNRLVAEKWEATCFKDVPRQKIQRLLFGGACIYILYY